MDIISLLSNKNSPMDKTMNSLKLNVQLFQLLKIAIFDNITSGNLPQPFTSPG